MPTWFCSRSWFDRLGGFDEIAKVSMFLNILIIFDSFLGSL
jgi:hypothetical protein